MNVEQSISCGGGTSGTPPGKLYGMLSSISLTYGGINGVRINFCLL